MNEKTKAILIGGVTLGLLSSIPFVNWANCCCLWMLGGGALTVFLYRPHAPAPLTPGDGVKLGAMAGAVGAAVMVVVGIPLGLLFEATLLDLMARLAEGFLPPESSAAFRQSMELARAQQSLTQRVLITVFSALYNSVIMVGVALAGGALGVKLFEKRKAGLDQSPPPPPDFSAGV